MQQFAFASKNKNHRALAMERLGVEPWTFGVFCFDLLSIQLVIETVERRKQNKREQHVGTTKRENLKRRAQVVAVMDMRSDLAASRIDGLFIYLLSERDFHLFYWLFAEKLINH